MTATNDGGHTVAHATASLGKPMPEKYFSLRDGWGVTVVHELSAHSPERLSKE